MAHRGVAVHIRGGASRTKQREAETGRVMMGWKGDAMRKDDVRQGKPPISILLIQGTNPNAGSRLWL